MVTGVQGLGIRVLGLGFWVEGVLAAVCTDAVPRLMRPNSGALSIGMPSRVLQAL